ALSIALLVSTGLLIRSLGNLRRVDPGVSADHVLEAGIYPALLRYDRAREDQLYRTLTQTLDATPGIESSALARYALFHAGLNFVSSDLFATLGVRVTEGRDLTGAEVTDRAHVAVINEPAARAWFPGGRAVGRLVPRESGEGIGPLTIVGVVPAINPSYRRPHSKPSADVPRTLAPHEALGPGPVCRRLRAAAAAP